MVIFYSFLYVYQAGYLWPSRDQVATWKWRGSGHVHRARAVAFLQRRNHGNVWKFTGEHHGLSSGKHTKSYGKSPFLTGKSTISMAIFNSYVTNYQRVVVLLCILKRHRRLRLNQNTESRWLRGAHTMELRQLARNFFRCLMLVFKLWGFKSLSLSQEKGSCLDSERHHGDAGSSGCAGMRLSSFCLPFAKPDRCFGSLLAISSASGSIIGCRRDLRIYYICHM